MLMTKRFEDLAIGDVEELCHLQYPESDQVEFKEFVPGRTGPDIWHEGADRISSYGRDELLSEVVGLANTRGGHLIVGIQESEDNPKRAVAIRAVPRCVELAERLRQQAYACIEPRLSDLQVVGIPVNAVGEGLVIVRVRESPTSPHRLEPTKECYVRRGDSTQRMTMREIQDLTLNAVRGLDLVQQKFTAFQHEFEAHARPTAMYVETARVGIRASSAPIQRLNLDRPTVVNALGASRREFRITRQHGERAGGVVPIQPHNGRPILRGHLLLQETEHRTLSHAAFDDGSQSAFVAFTEPAKTDSAGVIAEAWVVGLALSVLGVAKALATAGGGPTLEFALEVQLTGPNQSPRIHFDGFGGFERPKPIGRTSFVLPSYSYVPEHGEIQVIELLTADLCNAAGLERLSPITQIA